MKMDQPARSFQKAAAILVTAMACVLSACSSNPAATTVKPVAPVAPTIKENQTAPSIIIKSRSSKAITEDIIRYRTSKGMKVRNKTSLNLEFMMVMSNTTIPTEARMVYALNQTEHGWRLSARVYQITNPGSQQEKVKEITAAVSDKLIEELATYAKISGKP
jgi:hypothetical protein